jgi:hypothetical protein
MVTDTAKWQTLSKEPTTALGRLNQLKAAAGATAFDQELEKAKALKKVCSIVSLYKYPPFHVLSQQRGSPTTPP